MKHKHQKIKTNGDIPSARFGHSFTIVSQNKAVLFGGAISNKGFVPSQRAAHSAVMISQLQLVIYGGAASGTQGLLKDQLYLLDLRKDIPLWKIIEVANKSHTPGQRYGHTMSFNMPYLVIFGGNSGNRAQNDVWMLNITKGPFTWEQYDFGNKITPCPRVYHSASLCIQGRAAGMIIVYGGRKQIKRDHNGSQKQLSVAALNDIWGLRKHRDGTWDWTTPPRSQNYIPICRYQHHSVFMGSNLIIMGGRSNNMEQNVSAIEIYDTELSQWYRQNSISRYRHAMVLYGKNKLYIHGGFEPDLASQPLDSLFCLDLSHIIYRIPNQNGNKWSQIKEKKEQLRENVLIDTTNTNIMNNNKVSHNVINTINKNTPNMKNAMNIKNTMNTVNILNGIKTTNISYIIDKNNSNRRDLTPTRIINEQKNIRLSNTVTVATTQNSCIQIQKIPVNSLMKQSKRLTYQPQINTQNINIRQLCNKIIKSIIVDKRVQYSQINSEIIVCLSKQTTKILMKQSSLIGVKSPTKIFGSLYGQYNDLIRIFQLWNYPDENQMEMYQYIFMGNLIGKGNQSLEILCFIMALKIKFPQHIHLIRGRHQSYQLNFISGLAEECITKLGENIHHSYSIFNTLNYMFNSMPLAAVIGDHYLCINNGIGRIKTLLEIKEIQRPQNVKQNQCIIDLLWSTYGGCTQLDLNSHKATLQQIQQFIENNNIESIISTKDNILMGVNEQDNIINIISVLNYGNNKGGGILKINKDMSITPCIISEDKYHKNIKDSNKWINLQNHIIKYNSKQLQLRNKLFQFT